MLINNNIKQGAVMQNFLLRGGSVMQIKYFKFRLKIINKIFNNYS